MKDEFARASPGAATCGLRKRRACGKSGAGAHALQNLAVVRRLPLYAKRLGVRNASSALDRQQASITQSVLNLKLPPKWVLSTVSKRGLPTTMVSSMLFGMSATDILAKARELRPEERREIAEALLDDLESEESPEFIAELERRADDALKNPDDCIPWEQIRADSKKRYNWP
jgi:putative addiction module component (TIGR02574 family)